MGNYVKNNLLRDESIVYEAKLHWFYWVKPILLIAILLYIGTHVYHYGYLMVIDSLLGDLLSPICFLASIVIFIVKLIPVATLEMVITNKRLIIKQGYISRSTYELQMSQIESIGLEQSFFGRIFNYGTISVSGTGGARKKTGYIADPLSFRNAFFDEKEKLSKTGG